MNGLQDFVLTLSYHGATLLAVLLSNHPDAIYPGDTNPRSANDRCSCGVRMPACPFWSAALAGQHQPSGRKLLPTVPTLLSNPSANVRLTAAMSVAAIRFTPSIWRLARSRVDSYADTWGSFKDGALKASGARLLVDGEKSVTKFLVFRSLGNDDVRVIHLTRDPRGFIHSARRHKLKRGLAARTPDALAAAWVRGHKNILRASRGLTDEQYLRLRYEDLATAPKLVMKQVSSFLGLAEHDVFGMPKDPVHVVGNPMSFDWDGVIKLDTAWKGAISVEDQERVARATEPLLSRFGYPF